MFADLSLQLIGKEHEAIQAAQVMCNFWNADVSAEPLFSGRGQHEWVEDDTAELHKYHP